jgi:hypothetical protein
MAFKLFKYYIIHILIYTIQLISPQILVVSFGFPALRRSLQAFDTREALLRKGARFTVKAKVTNHRRINTAVIRSQGGSCPSE